MQDVELCAIMRAEDGRWRARPCTELYPNACRSQQGGWALVEGESRGTCPEGTAFAVPRHAKENAALQRALQHASQEACWLPLQGDSCTNAGSVSVSVLGMLSQAQACRMESCAAASPRNRYRLPLQSNSCCTLHRRCSRSWWWWSWPECRHLLYVPLCSLHRVICIL